MKTAVMLKEPLVHFVVIGVLIFVAYAVFNPSAAVDERTIVVSRAKIDQLAQVWTQQLRRAPTAEELKGLIDDHIREEILYREALGLGLEENDTIIRRRLAQKMQFLVEDLTAPADPDDATLQAFFEAHPDWYEVPAKLSFRHVYFSRDRRGDKAAADAELLLLALRDQEGESAPLAGDPFMLRAEYADVSPRDVARDFGDGFAAALFEVRPGQWNGPLESAYGLHLVKVSSRSEPRLPALAEVRDRVAVDWRVEQRREIDRIAFARLKEGYDVRIEDGASR